MLKLFLITQGNSKGSIIATSRKDAETWAKGDEYITQDANIYGMGKMAIENLKNINLSDLDLPRDDEDYPTLIGNINIGLTEKALNYFYKILNNN